MRNFYHTNYILNGFSAHQATMIMEVAFWMYENSVEEHPDDGNKPLKPGQEPPLTFIAMACAAFPILDEEIPFSVQCGGSGDAESVWERIAIATRKFLDENIDKIPEELRAPRIPRVGAVGDEATINEWYEEALQDMDDFVNDWRARMNCQDIFDHGDGVRYCDAYPEKMETALFYERWFTWGHDV